MANEAIFEFSSAFTLDPADTGALTAGSYLKLGTITVTNTTTVNNRPDLNGFLKYSKSSASTASGQTVSLHWQGLDVQGTLDEPGVDAAFGGHYMQSFPLDAGAGTAVAYACSDGSISLSGCPIKMALWAKNNTAVSMDKNDFVLYLTPWTFEPAA